MMKTYKYVFLLSCLLLSACTQDYDYPDENAETHRGTVYLNLQSAEINVENTRSVIPQDPMTDNPMYNLFLLHYSFEGQLIETEEISFESDEPALSYSWNPTLTIDSEGRVETLCLVANMKGEYPAVWPQRLADLKEICAALQFDSKGLVADKKMYLFGYYEGIVARDRHINIMMGRMATALRFVLDASDKNVRYRISKIEIMNVSRETYFFPHRSTEDNFKENIIESFSNANDDNTIGKDLVSERSYYYQVGENIDPADNKRTTITITAAKGTYQWIKWNYASSKTYTVVLGCDAPGTPNRNYSLYRNNNYTFNITLND